MTNGVDRVYCCNCKHACLLYKAQNICGHPDNMTATHSAWCKTEMPITDLNTINKNNDCRWYENKWLYNIGLKNEG